MKLSTLYKRTTTGALEEWTVEALGDRVVSTYGLVGGKMQTASRRVKPKNIGRANETTAEVQAEREAASEWRKRVDRKGYVEDIERAKGGQTDQGCVKPMLAQKYTEFGHRVAYPCYVQPKLDGARCLAVVTDAGVELWSRSAVKFTAVPHISTAVAQLGLPVGTILDGELYNHELHDDFQKIISVIRKKEPAAPDVAALIQYHVYDIVRHPRMSIEATTSERMDRVSALSSSDYVKVVPTRLVASETLMYEAFEAFRAEGYEGLMVRQPSYPYEHGRRSLGLQKVKAFDEDEFEVIGVKEGRGRMEGKAVFVCRTQSGLEFDSKMDGPLEALRVYWEDPSTCIGKMLTVVYQGFTDDGKPRFNVGKALRDYE